MTKKEFFKKLNEYGWQDVKKATEGMKGTIIKIDPKKEYDYIILPHINMPK